MRIHIVALALAIVSLASCVQYEARPLDPNAEYEALAGRSRSNLADLDAVDLPRKLFPLTPEVSPFDGLSIAESNALALYYAPAVLEARGRLRLQGAELLRAGLLDNPELFVGPRLTTDGSGAVFPASLALRIPVGGELEADEQRAASELEAARCLLLEAEAKALVSVRRAFIDIAALRLREEVLEFLVTESKAALETMQQLATAGEGDGIAVALAVIERDELLQDLREARTRATEIRCRLAASIGLLPGAEIGFVTGPDLLEAEAPPATDRARLLEHPLLRSVQAAYEASEHGLEVEIARQYPTLHLGPEFESSDGSPSFGIGLSISLPIFDRNQGGIAVATEHRTERREAWHAALLELSEREASARSRFENAQAALDDLRATTIPAAQSARTAIEARLSGGQISLIEALTVRRSIARTRLREIDLMRDAAGSALEALWYSGQLFTTDHSAGKGGSK